MNIHIKGVIDEDFVNYKKPAMFIAFPNCSFKCEKECGVRCCQNSELAQQPNIDVDTNDLANRYASNDITSAIVIGGMEPFDNIVDLFSVIKSFRKVTDDVIVVYTGYKEDEVKFAVSAITTLGNIIIKYGRFTPNCESHYDEVLGVNLASPNQYAKYYK